MPAAPDKYFDGTNPILTIVGDEPTERDVSMTNNASIVKTELLTNTQLPPGQTVLVRVKGDMAFDQIISNLEQINAMNGFEVIGVTSVPVEEESNDDPFAFVNAQFYGENMQYTGGTIAFDYFNGLPAFAITTPAALNKYYTFGQPNYDIGGVNVFSEVLLIISPNSNARDAYNNRMAGNGGFAVDQTPANGANTGVSISKAGALNLFTKTGTDLRVTAQVVNDAVNWAIYNPDGGITDDYSDAQPDIQNQQLYCHVIAILHEEYNQVDLAQIRVPLALEGMELS